MREPRAEAAQYSEIGDILLACAPVVKEFYLADCKAFSYHEEFRENARKAAWYGTGAIVLAVFVLLLRQFVQTDSRIWMLTALEGFAALYALVVVVRGINKAHKEKWLLERNRAERCRLLKFGILIDKEIWGNTSSANYYEKVGGPLAEIRSNDVNGLWEWVAKDPPPQCVSPEMDIFIHPKALNQLIDYYQKKGLNFK